MNEFRFSLKQVCLWVTIAAMWTALIRFRPGFILFVAIPLAIAVYFLVLGVTYKKWNAIAAALLLLV